MSLTKSIFAVLSVFFVLQTQAFANQEEPAGTTSDKRTLTPPTIVDQVTTTAPDGTRQVMFQLSDGTTSTATYDSSERLISIQGSNNRFVLRYHFDSTTVRDTPIAISSENMESGVVSYRVTAGQKNVVGLNVAAGDEQCNQDGNCTSGWGEYPPIISNPFGGGWGGFGFAPAPEPPKCKKDDCNDLCDAGAGAGLAGCAAMALVPGPGDVAAIVCGAAMLGAQWECRRRCRQCQ